MKYFVARQESKGNPLLRFHVNTTHVVDSCIYANNNKRERIVAFPWQDWLQQSATM
jgi:hypothetical protein